MLTLGAALFLFAWGLFVLDFDSWKWAILSLLVFWSPLFCQRSVRRWVRYGAVWAALALWAQCFLPFFSSSHLLRNEPNRNDVLDFDHQLTLPGMHGIHHYRTDENGFRVTGKIDYAGKPGLRIFTVGASTTVCEYLDDQQTWPALLEKKLRERGLARHVEVINAGVNGTLVRHQHAMLKTLVRFRPDLVIFLPGVNDWNYQIKDTFGSRTQRRHFRETLLLKYSPLVSFVNHRVLGRSASAADRPFLALGTEKDPYAKLRGSLNRPDQRSFKPAEVAKEFAATLPKMAAVCRDSGIRCVFLTQPTAYAPAASRATRDSFWMTPFFEPYTVTYDSLLHLQNLYNGHVLRFAETARQPAFDLARQIEPAAETFVDDVHYTEAGAERVAEAVAVFLLGWPELMHDRHSD